MKFSRSQFLAVSSFFLIVWFRFESSFHSHLLLNFLAPILSIALFIPLWKSTEGKNRYVIGGLWLLISGILVTDCAQTLLFSKYSDSRFQQKISEVTSTVKERTQREVDVLGKDISDVKNQLDAIEILNPSSIFIRLQDHLSKSDYGWAIYDADGELIAWKGEFPPRETMPTNGTAEITVYNALHQQFMRMKRGIISRQLSFTVVVNRPIAADYGIRNRYLKDYNLLTDHLPIRPDLLYNSQVVAPYSSDIVIKTIPVTSDFSITVLFKKHQYGEFLQNQRFLLHWWFELAALIYILFAVIYSFFEFIGVSGKFSSKRYLLRSWSFIFLISLFGLILISEVSAFETSTIFGSGSTQPQTWARLNSPGGLLLASFFALNVLWSLALLLWKIRPLSLSKSPGWNYAFFGLCSMIAAVLIREYLTFIQRMLFRGAVDPMEFSVAQTNFLKLSHWLGLLWLDLSFLVTIAILFGLGLAFISERNYKQFSLVLLTQIAAGLLFFFLLEGHTVPLFTSLILYFGIGTLMFFVPELADHFGRLNLFSRFLIVLLLFSFVSFVFHFTRFHFAGGLRKEFVEQAALQVQNQDQAIQTVIASSRAQLDQALTKLSIDPKIPDLAFRLWTRTDLGRFGFRSALEIYDEAGRLVNRFSVNLPRLPVPILDAVLEGGWGNERRNVLLGNVRKPVHFAVRDIPNVGFLVIEAAQDYENLPFMAPSNPFQELFRSTSSGSRSPLLRVSRSSGTPKVVREELQNKVTPDLNVYDSQWRPVFVSRADLSLSTQQGQDLLRESASGWVREKWADRDLDVFLFPYQ